jgi:hypothetical protein
MAKNITVPIDYTSRDYDSIKKELVDHAKRYYPDTFQDFNEAGFGSLMLDTVAYVGDILSYYVDYQANEAFVDTASEFDNLVSIGEQTGFKLQQNPSSHGIATFFSLVPADSTSGDVDTAYLPILKRGSSLMSASGAKFTLDEDVNFINGTTVVARTNATTGAPTFFAVKAYGAVSSGELKSTTIGVGRYAKFRNVLVADSNITEIVSVADSDGHEYFEVDYLSQNIVMKSTPNRDSSTSGNAREILKPLVVPRRFTTKNTENGTSLQFGSGAEESSVQEEALDPSAVAVKMYGKEYISDVEMDPSKLLSSDSLGISPSNTQLTIVYRGNTKEDTNISTNSLTSVTSPVVEFVNEEQLNFATAATIRSSIECTNESPIVGSIKTDDIEDLRKRVMNSFANQRRAVTLKDYETMCYSMPYKFGTLKRVKAIRNPNPRRGNLLIATIAEDDDDKLYPANSVIKDNLKTWLDKGRMVSDVIDIVDAKVVNLGINFTVIGDLNKDTSIVLDSCMSALAFSLKSRPDIGEAFYITDIYKTLKDVEGVIDVSDVSIVSKYGEEYSSVAFSPEENLSEDGRAIIIPRNGIYEIKYPNYDIKGAVK